MQGLIDLIKPKFMSNLHSVGEWLLYPRAGRPARSTRTFRSTSRWPGPTPTPRSRASTPASRPTRSTSPTARRPTTPTRTPARSPSRRSSATPAPAAGSSSPTTRRSSRRSSRRRCPSTSRMARSATDADDPVSPVGITTQPFYLNLANLDPQHNAQTLFDFKFDVSYGNPQEARILAKRSLGRCRSSTASMAGRCRPRRRASGTAARSTARARAPTTTS